MHAFISFMLWLLRVHIGLQVTMLHMPQLCYAISAKGLASVMGLTRLRHLRLVTYSAHLTDAEFHSLAGVLANLSIPLPKTRSHAMHVQL